MKRRIAMLFVLVMILSCMPVMAAAVPAGAADSSKTVSVQASGWVKSGTTWMYYVNGKALKSQIATIGKKKYAFDANGKLCLGFFKLWGSTYYASRNQGSKGCGEILTGYRKIGPAFFYLDPAKNGRVTKGFVRIGGKLRYFRMKDGYQRTTKGWFQYGTAKYYVKADGTIATNTTIDGYKIGADGAVRDLAGMDKKAQGYDSNTRYLILVNKSKHLVNFYKGSKGHWTIIKRNIPCTIGKSSTPTKSGNFKLSIRSERVYGYKDFGSATAFYATRINAGNFFHSVLYKLGCRNPYTHSPKDARMGKNISNSCIRLPLADAKYIYENFPRYTRTVVY